MLELLRGSIHRRKTKGCSEELKSEYRERLDELLDREVAPKSKNLFKLRRSNIKENHIEFTTIKTTDTLRIELNKYSRGVLDKYKDVAFQGDKALPVITSQKIYGNEQGEIDVRSSMQSFALHIPPDTKTEKPIVHISLNPHPDDKLSDEQLVEIAKEYLEGMGYGEQPYLIYKHDDIEQGHNIP